MTSSCGTDETRTTGESRFFTLRQQMEKTNEKGQFALSDFVRAARRAPTISAALR